MTIGSSPVASMPDRDPPRVAVAVTTAPAELTATPAPEPEELAVEPS